MRYMQNLDALAVAVSSEMERQKLNTYEVAERARKKGYKIVHGTVWNVINRQVKEVKDKSIVAIAHGLNLPERVLFDIVRGKDSSADIMIDGRFLRLAERYTRLSADEKNNIEPFLSALEETIDRIVPVLDNPAKKAKKTKGKTITTSDGRVIPLVDGAVEFADED